MSGGFHIFCGRCDESVKVLTQIHAEEKAVCPKCGQTDDLKEALRIAGDHETDGFKEGLAALIRQRSGDAGNFGQSSTGGRPKWYFVKA